MDRPGIRSTCETTRLRSYGGPLVSNHERALTVKDVAQQFGVTTGRVYGWIKGGHIRPSRLPNGGPYRFRRSDIDEFWERCRVGSSNDQTTVSALEAEGF